MVSGGGKCCSPVMCACVVLPPPPSSGDLFYSFTLLFSQVPFQLLSPLWSTGDIEENSLNQTAQLRWPPAKQRRTSGAEGTRSVFIW